MANFQKYYYRFRGGYGKFIIDEIEIDVDSFTVEPPNNFYHYGNFSFLTFKFTGSIDGNYYPIQTHSVPIDGKQYIFKSKEEMEICDIIC